MQFLSVLGLNEFLRLYLTITMSNNFDNVKLTRERNSLQFFRTSTKYFTAPILIKGILISSSSRETNDRDIRTCRTQDTERSQSKQNCVIVSNQTNTTLSIFIVLVVSHFRFTHREKAEKRAYAEAEKKREKEKLRDRNSCHLFI